MPAVGRAAFIPFFLVCRVFPRQALSPMVIGNAQGGGTKTEAHTDVLPTLFVVLPGVFLPARYTGAGPAVRYGSAGHVNVGKPAVFHFRPKKARRLMNLTTRTGPGRRPSGGFFHAFMRRPDWTEDASAWYNECGELRRWTRCRSARNRPEEPCR